MIQLFETPKKETRGRPRKIKNDILCNETLPTIDKVTIKNNDEFGNEIENDPTKVKTSTKHRHHAFTFNYGPGTTIPDYEKYALEQLCKSFYDKQENIIYMLCGFELGKNQIKHIQGYIQFKNPRSFNKVVSELQSTLKGAHVEECVKSSFNNSIYCKKEGNYFFFGNPDFIESKIKTQGERTDLDTIYAYIDQNLTISQELRKSKTYTLYYKAFESYLAKAKQEHHLKKQIDFFKSSKLNTLQIYFENLVLKQDNRTIDWVYDPIGNNGKSFFCNYYSTLKGAFLMLNGATKDIAQCYNYEDVALVNFVRSEEDRINYTIMENFKDGRIFRSKYESAIIARSPIKVIVFANFVPTLKKCSEDRWRIHMILPDGSIKIKKQIIKPIIKIEKLDISEISENEYFNLINSLHYY
uniref:Replication protein n=1 Tax=Cruciviridae sp. TaxID=1955495 RepID=A0A1S6LVH9_9VIRU|nr:replication protein [Cruciviridae sp.]